MPNYTTRICPVCNKEYQADIGRLKHGRQTTCSRECSYKLRADKQRNLTSTPRSTGKRKRLGKQTRECLSCGDSITKIGSAFRYKNTFCCNECYQVYRRSKAKHPAPRQKKFCVICGTIFKPISRSGRIQSHCSRKCFEVSHKHNMTGKNNPSYIDGRSYGATYDAGVEWHRIRFEVYERDNFTCQSCGVKCVSKADAMKYPEYSKRIIQCHHINPYNESQDNSLDNLRTLCISCHRGIHLGKVRNDAKQ